MSNGPVSSEVYETVPVRVKVQTFTPSGSNSNIYAVTLVPCSCDAMDSHTCDQHSNPPEYNFVLRDTSLSVYPGDKVVTFPRPGHEVEVYRPREFLRLFRGVTK